MKVVIVGVVRAFEHADQRAAFSYGWADFRPTGLIIYRDDSSEAVMLPGEPSVRDVVVATGRASRKNFRRVAALGVMCAAWASRQAVGEMGNPSDASDRVRARVIYAADTEGLTHIYSNVAGQTNYEQHPAETDLGIGGFIYSVIAEATFASQFWCPSGSHERKAIL